MLDVGHTSSPDQKFDVGHTLDLGCTLAVAPIFVVPVWPAQQPPVETFIT